MGSRNTSNIKSSKQVIPSIGGNTQIIFTIKSFLATIGSILGIFATFYFLVFVPRIDKSEQYQKDLYHQQELYISSELGKVNDALKTNSNTITDLTNKVNDLSITVKNSGGGFSSNNKNTTSTQPAVGVDEISLAEISE